MDQRYREIKNNSDKIKVNQLLQCDLCQFVKPVKTLIIFNRFETLQEFSLSKNLPWQLLKFARISASDSA